MVFHYRSVTGLWRIIRSETNLISKLQTLFEQTEIWFIFSLLCICVCELKRESERERKREERERDAIHDNLPFRGHQTISYWPAAWIHKFTNLNLWKLYAGLIQCCEHIHWLKCFHLCDILKKKGKVKVKHTLLCLYYTMATMEKRNIMEAVSLIQLG